jgi:hypothetical protein
MFGVLPEAVALAAVLAAPKSPFRVATELVQRDPLDYSETVGAVMQARHKLDCGVGSEPLLLVNLLWLYRTHAKGKASAAAAGASTTKAFTGKASSSAAAAGSKPMKRHDDFFSKYAVAHIRMRQLDASYGHLASRVASALQLKPTRAFQGQRGGGGHQSAAAAAAAVAEAGAPVDLDIALTLLRGGDGGGGGGNQQLGSCTVEMKCMALCVQCQVNPRGDVPLASWYRWP